MITVEQIKAARALLDWNQDQLAKAAGMSKPALTNLERRISSPRKETLDAIKAALEEAGIEFTEGPGVRLSASNVKVTQLRGSDCIQRLWNDILETLKPGEERLIYGVDEDVYLKHTGPNFEKTMEKYLKKNITGRIISAEGNHNFADKSSTYRWLNKELLKDITPYYVYGNKFALLIWQPSPSILLIENSNVSNSFRLQFEAHWKTAKIPN
jgi:transcriptional regulator with XRE-family HTH domain